MDSYGYNRRISASADPIIIARRDGNKGNSAQLPDHSCRSGCLKMVLAKVGTVVDIEGVDCFIPDDNGQPHCGELIHVAVAEHIHVAAAACFELLLPLEAMRGIGALFSLWVIFSDYLVAAHDCASRGNGAVFLAATRHGGRDKCCSRNDLENDGRNAHFALRVGGEDVCDCGVDCVDWRR